MPTDFDLCAAFGLQDRVKKWAEDNPLSLDAAIVQCRRLIDTGTCQPYPFAWAALWAETIATATDRKENARIVLETLERARNDLEYKLARQIGDRRFGSDCKHERAERGHCLNCGRRVI